MRCRVRCEVRLSCHDLGEKRTDQITGREGAGDAISRAKGGERAGRQAGSGVGEGRHLIDDGIDVAGRSEVHLRQTLYLKRQTRKRASEMRRGQTDNSKGRLEGGSAGLYHKSTSLPHLTKTEAAGGS